MKNSASPRIRAGQIQWMFGFEREPSIQKIWLLMCIPFNKACTVMGLSWERTNQSYAHKASKYTVSNGHFFSIFIPVIAAGLSNLFPMNNKS